MLRKAVNPAKSGVRKLLRLSVQGNVFRFYTWPTAAPAPASRLRIAVCHLIPNLGDAVMLFPLLDALRRENPAAEISCFTSGGGRVLGLHPAVDHLHVFAQRLDWRRKFSPVDYIYDIWSWWHRELRELKFDVCVVLRGGVDPFHSAHLAWLLGGRERVGYSSDLEPEHRQHDLHPSSLLTKEVLRFDGVHEVSRGEEVLKRAGLITESIDLNKPVTSMLQIAKREKGHGFVASIPELHHPYAIVAPGASVERRQWPAERFWEVTEREILPRGWMPVFVGGPEIAMTCETIASALSAPSLNLAGRTSFEELAALCAGAECFVGNDSGPGHVAGACGVPALMVTAFAERSRSTHHASPNRSRFLGPHFALVQPLEQMSPCLEECVADEVHCLLKVQVEDVRRAFQDLMIRSEEVRGVTRMMLR